MVSTFGLNDASTPAQGHNRYGKIQRRPFSFQRLVGLSCIPRAGSHYAAGMGREEVAGLLMKYNADVNAKNNRGETPIYTALHHAIEPKKLISLLRQHGGHE